MERSKETETIEEERNQAKKESAKDFMTIGRHADGRSEEREGWSERGRGKENERKPARREAERKRPGSHPEGQRRAVEFVYSWCVRDDGGKRSRRDACHISNNDE